MAREEDGDATARALEELYRSGYPRFLRLALAIVGSSELAADVVQEAFARALRSRRDFRGDGPLEAWVWRTVMNTARSASRRTRGDAGVPETLAPHENGHAEPWPELRAAVAALPERQRYALFLRHYADLDYDSIAQVLGVARGTVSATLHAAHASLRRSLGEVRR